MVNEDSGHPGTAIILDETGFIKIGKVGWIQQRNHPAYLFN